MAEYTDVITLALDSALTAIKQAEETAVSAVAEWTERIAAMPPGLPELPFASQVPQPARSWRTTRSFAGCSTPRRPTPWAC